MSQMEKYHYAWDYYLTSCEKYGIETKIDYAQFIHTLTAEQIEALYEKSYQHSA